MALYFISENLAWAAMATFMAAINTATTTYNAAGPPKTIAHVTAWIQAVDAAATTANSSSQITNAALGATASASAVQAWYNALQSMLTIRAKGH